MKALAPKDGHKTTASTSVTKETSNVLDSPTRKLRPPEENSVEATPDNDIFIAAQYGDWQRIELLIKQGIASATSKNEQGITPLHWAAINDRLLACKTLIDHGADVNAVGGDLNATPMMWAAKSGHTYIVHLLIHSGGDPAMTDNQGYNVLQLATHSSNVLLLIYLLHLDMPPDCVDPQGHTCLMWAAYQGDALSVEVLLTWGADVKIRDHDGLTSLHWAVVRGNRQCIEKIIAEGADLTAKQNEGKTAHSLAIELKTSKALETALNTLGRDPDSGMPLRTYGSMEWSLKAIFILPLFYIGVILELFSVAPIMISLPINALLIYGTQQLISSFLIPPNLRSTGIHKTPHLAGIFAGSAIWTMVHWCTSVLPSIGRLHPYLNASFGAIFITCLYCFFSAMRADPGFVPKHGGGRSEQREAIEELLRDGEFDNQHFCVNCLLRKPLRSKHCRICSRCVARHDHHCPWINNCVGVCNHRAFMSYIVLLFFGIPLYAYIMSLHLAHKGTVSDPLECTLLAEAYCHWLQIDSFGILLTIWDCLQMTWVTMLVLVQLWQISRATTTQEVVNIRRHGYMGGARDPPRRLAVASAVASVITSGTTDPAGAALDSGGGGPTTAPTCEHHHHHNKKGAGGGFMKTVARLLGVDQFVDTAKMGRHRKVDNPFDGGVASNCNDFWRVPSRDIVASDGAGLVKRVPVDYYKLYAVPSPSREMYARLPSHEEV